METHRLAASVLAVVRSFNNAFIAKQVQLLLDLGVGHVLVITDDERDMGATRGWLDRILRRPEPKVTVLDIKYTWSAGLNAAANWMFEENERRRGLSIPEFSLFMPVSVEAKPTSEQFSLMLDELERDARLGLLGTSFEGIKDGNVVDLGVSYAHPRNTLAIYRIGAIQAIHEFAAFCDKAGGQEDIEYLIRIELDGRWKWRLLDLKVTLYVGKNFEQGGKEEREELAIARIIAHHRQSTPEDQQEVLTRIFDDIRLRIGME